MASWGKFNDFLFLVEFEIILHHQKDHTKEWFIQNE